MYKIKRFILFLFDVWLHIFVIHLRAYNLRKEVERCPLLEELRNWNCIYMCQRSLFKVSVIKDFLAL